MEIFFIAIISLIFGSFVSCLSYRLANKQKFVMVRSKCVECGYKLRVFNLIPLFSWFFQRGKCTNCHKKISIRYPLIELLFLASFLAFFFILGQKIDQKFIFLCIIAIITITMAIIDIEKYFIPDILQIALLIVAIIFSILQFGAAKFLWHLAAGAVYALFTIALYFLFLITTRQAAIGIDDIKLMPALGIILGFDKFLSFMFFAGIFGIIFGSIWIWLKKDDAFPFAPALCTALFASILFKFDLVLIIDKILF